jgi:hypothetical protein
MSSVAPIVIDAVVSDSERPALIATAEQFGECLGAATGGEWPVSVRFRDSLASIDVRDRPTLVIASMLPDLAGDEPLRAIAARWRDQLSSLAPMNLAAIFICTIFRRLADPDTADSNRPLSKSPANPQSARSANRLSDAASDARRLRLERLLRLNLMAIELSHDTGAGVIDIDRLFAHLGAGPLATDHRLTGRVAAEVAAYAIVATIVSFGLDDIMSPQIQEQAMRSQGNHWNIGRLVERRLGQRL